ncbi:unnamed protein product [Closterium sp. Naga37s-1]|nr:unnamed protein product [Closterium sp. Naga37s-1]
MDPSAPMLPSSFPHRLCRRFPTQGRQLLNDNLMGFVRAPALVIVTSVFILIGNTMYPPTLRALLLLLRHFSRGEKRFVYSYLLVHPRKCYTHLFPPRSTVMLVLTVLVFNLTEFVFFCATDWTSPAIDGFTSGTKVLAGYFQSVSTRNAGFNVIAIGLLRPPHAAAIPGHDVSAWCECKGHGVRVLGAWCEGHGVRVQGAWCESARGMV